MSLLQMNIQLLAVLGFHLQSTLQHPQVTLNSPRPYSNSNHCLTSLVSLPPSLPHSSPRLTTTPNTFTFNSTSSSGVTQLTNRTLSPNKTLPTQSQPTQSQPTQSQPIRSQPMLSRSQPPYSQYITDQQSPPVLRVVAAISASICTIVISLAICVVVMQRRKKLLPKPCLPQGHDNTIVGDSKDISGTVWVSHALTHQGGPVKRVYDLECKLQSNGYKCLSALLEKTQIANQGFNGVYTLMKSADQIVVCCDREYSRWWTRMEEGQLSAEEKLHQTTFVHEHSVIITERGDGYKRLVVVLLGDTHPDCIPLCLKATQYYRFPDDKDFINLIHRLQNTEPIAPPGTQYDVECSTSKEDLLQESTV